METQEIRIGMLVTNGMIVCEVCRYEGRTVIIARFNEATGSYKYYRFLDSEIVADWKECTAS